VRPGAGDVGLGRVEGHVVDALVRLLPVGGDLLHARLAVQVPQAHLTVMAWGVGRGCWRSRLRIRGYGGVVGIQTLWCVMCVCVCVCVCSLANGKPPAANFACICST